MQVELQAMLYYATIDALRRRREPRGTFPTGSMGGYSRERSGEQRQRPVADHCKKPLAVTCPRCQRTSVPGCTIGSASRHAKQCDSMTGVSRDGSDARRGFTSRSWYRASCLRRRDSRRPGQSSTEGWSPVTGRDQSRAPPESGPIDPMARYIHWTLPLQS